MTRGDGEEQGSPTPPPNVSSGDAASPAQEDWYSAAASDQRPGFGPPAYGYPPAAGYQPSSADAAGGIPQYGSYPAYGGYAAGSPTAGYWPAGYGTQPTGAARPPKRHGSRPALIAIAAVAGVAMLAVGFGGGVGAALFVRNEASQTPSVSGGGGSAGSGGSGGGGNTSNSVDLSSLAGKLDPAIVDLNGIQQNASGQTVAEDAGTGVILTSNGEVLTNNHVVEGNSSMTATLATGKTVDVKVLGEDPTADIALVQLEGVSGLPTINIQSGARATVGDAIAAFGNALGKGGTPAASQGSVTGLNQSITASLDSGSQQTETLNGLIEMSAQICPGDSGGVLANAQGQYLGILTAASSSSGGSGQQPGDGGSQQPGSGGSGSSDQSCSTDGFVIPAANAEAIVKQIQSGRRTQDVIIGVPGFLGVEVGGQTSVDGAQVEQLVAGGPAAQAGLPSTFVITAIDGQAVSSSSALSTVLQQYTPGTTVQVTWNDGAGGASQTTSVTLGSGPPA
ncbi:MAG: S1C family serine protease [Candidatus Dormibacteraceae bacterium]